jgi:hypothetical protein
MQNSATYPENWNILIYAIELHAKEYKTKYMAPFFTFSEWYKFWNKNERNFIETFHFTINFSMHVISTKEQNYNIKISDYTFDHHY